MEITPSIKLKSLPWQNNNEVEAKAMFADLDADGDGIITAHEFMDYFLTLLKRFAKSDDLSKAGGKRLEKAKMNVYKVLANLEQNSTLETHYLDSEPRCTVIICSKILLCFSEVSN